MNALTQISTGVDSNLITSPSGKQFTNNQNIPKELALMFAHHASLYDGKPVSATTLSVSDLIGPMRKLLLKIKHPKPDTMQDISMMAKSSIGTILHTGLEEALNSVGGYTQEKRSETTIHGVTLSGKFDIVDPSGEVMDLKNVSAFAYKLFQTDRDNLQAGLDMSTMYHSYQSYFKLVAQLSFYRFLNQDLITKPYGTILFNLTSSSFEGFPTYSGARLPLFPVEEIQEFASTKILTMQQHLADDTLPLCSSKERGSRPAEYKLTRFSVSTNKHRTVNGSKFSNEADFQDFCSKKAKAGDEQVITPATHILCTYCPFYQGACDQI